MSALIAEGVFFSLIHPADLVFFNHANTLSSEAIYSIGFIFFWLLGALSSALTFYIRGGFAKDCLDLTHDERISYNRL
jgi:hypothetical protein